jgi:hypothetical protein
LFRGIVSARQCQREVAESLKQPSTQCFFRELTTCGVLKNCSTPEALFLSRHKAANSTEKTTPVIFVRSKIVLRIAQEKMRTLSVPG